MVKGIDILDLYLNYIKNSKHVGKLRNIYLVMILIEVWLKGVRFNPEGLGNSLGLK